MRLEIEGDGSAHLQILVTKDWQQQLEVKYASESYGPSIKNNADPFGIRDFGWM